MYRKWSTCEDACPAVTVYLHKTSEASIIWRALDSALRNLSHQHLAHLVVKVKDQGGTWPSGTRNRETTTLLSGQSPSCYRWVWRCCVASITVLYFAASFPGLGFLSKVTFSVGPGWDGCQCITVLKMNTTRLLKLMPEAFKSLNLWVLYCMRKRNTYEKCSEG
jgi:hypothetical protein